MDLYEIRRQMAEGKNLYEMRLRVTFYARVSTDKDEQLHSLSAQVQYYTEFIQKNSAWTSVNGYVDEGLSGTSVKKRESFLRMIDDARQGKFDFIITKEISRFSRSTLDSIRYTQDLLRCGVGVLFQSDNINTLDADSELRLTIMSSIAQDEVRKTSERVKFGFRRAIEKGIVLGNSKIWGYTKQNGTLAVLESEAAMVRSIFDLYANRGVGIRGICSWLSEHGYHSNTGGGFSFSTIKGILTNPKYKGFYCGNKSHKYDYRRSERKYLEPEDWVMYKDQQSVPPIVSEEIWDKANDILAKRSARQKSRDKNGYSNRYPYSGKIICGKHHCAYYRAVYRYSSGDRELWHCREYAANGTNSCNMPCLYTDELNSILIQILNESSLDSSRIIQELVKIYTERFVPSALRSDRLKQEAQIHEIMQRKDKLLDLSISGCLSDEEFELRNTRFNDQIEALNQKIRYLKDQESSDLSLTPDALESRIQQELNFAEGLPANLVDALIDRIEVLPDSKRENVHLHFTFRLFDNTADYHIFRRRKCTSVCSGQYT